MNDEHKEDGDGTIAPLVESGTEDVLVEKKRLARRRILLGTAAAGAVLGTVNRAHAVGASVCFSNFGADLPGFLENISHGNWQDKVGEGGLIFRALCGPGS